MRFASGVTFVVVVLVEQELETHPGPDHDAVLLMLAVSLALTVTSKVIVTEVSLGTFVSVQVYTPALSTREHVAPPDMGRDMLARRQLSFR